MNKILETNERKGIGYSQSPFYLPKFPKEYKINIINKTLFLEKGKNFMRKVIDAFNKIPHIVRIIAGLIVGIILGLTAPTATWIGIFGDFFVGALKAVAPILVFLLIASSISKAKPNIGKRFRTVIFLYMVTTLTAAIVAVIASYIFPVALTLPEGVEQVAPGSLGEVFKTLITNVVANPIGAIIEGNYLAILFWSIVFGFCLKKVANPKTIDAIGDVSEAVSKVVSFVIKFAPLGVMGLVFTSISTNGLEIFKEYGMLLAVLVGSMVFSSLIVNPFIIFLYLKRNPYPLVLTCLRESGIMAFFTRSSAANIPINMKLCKRLGLDKDFYSVSIPLGATINMDGAAITITVMAMAMCVTMGISVNPIMAVFLSVVATLGACGASGVAGGSLLLIPMACSLFGIGNDAAMSAVAIGFVIGVIQDSVETCLNSSGDAIFTATAEYHARKKAGEEVGFLGQYAKGYTGRKDD